MKQPKLEDFIKQNANSTEKDYKTKYIGLYKNHHRKLKVLFNKSTTKAKSNQVDKTLARLILAG